MFRFARIQIVLSTTSNQQFGVQEWLMKRAMLPPTAASRLLAGRVVPDQLAGVIDDATVRWDGFGCEDAVSMDRGSAANDPWKFLFRHHFRVF